MFYKIMEIDSIAPEYMRKLERVGITTTEHLLARARDAKARAQLAVSTGIGEKYLAKWSAMADLMRVRGIGRQYGELLLAVGVDSTDKLLTLEPNELIRMMTDQKRAKKSSSGVPKVTDVQQWQDELRAPVFARAK